MKKTTILCVISLFCVFSHKGEAYDDTPKCFKEVQVSFFQQPVILRAFGIHYRDIFQSQWDMLSQELMGTNFQVQAMIKERAKRMRPSPLEYPFQPDKAEDLLQTVAWELFLQVMRRHNITNQPMLQDVFNIIFQAEIERLRVCQKAS